MENLQAILVQAHSYLYDVETREAGIALLRKVESMGRISHRSEEAQGPDTWERFLTSVILEHGDWSITEHAYVTVVVVTDRGITHEIVRHRIASYTQESTRFVRYGKKHVLTFIMPEDMSPEDMTNNTKILDLCTQQYYANLDRGMKPQIARSFLPMALASKLAMTYNLRNWRHYFLMRTTRETHPELRRITIPLLAKFKEFIPLLYNDIVPMTRQRDAMRMMR